MSEIWLARDRQTQSVVALKFLTGDHAADAAARDRLHREWRTGSRLMHAHIVRVFEFHDDPDGAYFSLQAIDGPDMSVLAGAGIDNALRPLGLIADALRYAHAKGVVHGDIKAGNILLDSRGAPYLIDFGVAVQYGADTASRGGSEISRSPQLKAGHAPEPADDIYALGVLVGELVSGAPPDPRHPVSLRGPDGSAVPRALDALVNNMLSAVAANRPDAESVAAALDAAGFPAGRARIELATSMPAAAVDEPESIQPIAPKALRKERLPATPGMQEGKESARGVSATMVYAGLGLSLLLLIGVIFLLPEASDNTNDAVPPEASDSGAAVSDDLSTPQPGQGVTGFNENIDELSADDAARLLAATDEALGDLLSRLERLRYRAVDRWGGQAFLDALNIYQEGDAAYLDKNYASALRRYRDAIKMLDPFFDRIENVFRTTMTAADEALARGDHVEAIRLYDLAVAITPGNIAAEKGLARAQNLEAVMSLTDQGVQYEDDLELEAAKLSFEKALELDGEWQPAVVGLERVRVALREWTFNQRMTEGFDALAAGYYDSARAAFNAAKSIDPGSREAADGLLQVDQEVRLQSIRQLEAQAKQQTGNEQWELAVATFQALLDIDLDLQFAKEGLSEANRRVAIHNSLASYIDDPDSLSADVTMQKATRLLLDISRMPDQGPRLVDQKEELSRLLKRAATPLGVQLVSDGITDVSIYRVGKLGAFSLQELTLRPGVYVAVGSRSGYRDVRLEFRVAPEIEMKPIVIQCEEQI
jgi:serine/threonine protein kinase